MLFVLVELGATGSIHWTPSAAFDLALGLALIGLAFHLRTRQAPPATSKTASKLGRYLQSRRLAFVLGLTLYALPSPIYVGAVKTIADAEYSTSRELLALAVTVAVMLWLIEIPMLVAARRARSCVELIGAREPVVRRPRPAVGGHPVSRCRPVPLDQGFRRPPQLSSRCAWPRAWPAFSPCVRPTAPRLFSRAWP